MDDRKDQITDFTEYDNQREIKQYREKLENVKIAFFLLALLSFGGRLVTELIIYKEVNFYNLAIASGIALVYSGLALWIREKPFIAIITGIFFFIFETVLKTFLYTGISFKSTLLNLVVFVYLVIQAVEANKLDELIKRDKTL